MSSENKTNIYESYSCYFNNFRANTNSHDPLKFLRSEDFSYNTPHTRRSSSSLINNNQTSMINEKFDTLKISPQKHQNIEEKMKPVKLKLIVVEAKFLRKSKEIVISPLKSNENKIYNCDNYHFGKESQTNDFNFPQKEQVAYKQFTLFYYYNQGKYYIKDNEKSSGTFIKMQEKLLINKQYQISINDITIFINQPKNYEEYSLHLKVISNNQETKKFKFHPKCNPVVRIGRKNDLEVILVSSEISRVHCKFEFINGNWILFDGLEGKPTTNGIWLRANTLIPITNDTIIKTGNTTFKALLS